MSYPANPINPKLQVRYRYDAANNKLYIIDALTSRCILDFHPSWDAEGHRDAPPTPEELSEKVRQQMARLKTQHVEVVGDER